MMYLSFMPYKIIFASALSVECVVVSWLLLYKTCVTLTVEIHYSLLANKFWPAEFSTRCSYLKPEGSYFSLILNWGTDFPHLLGILDSLWRKVTFNGKDLGFAAKLCLHPIKDEAEKFVIVYVYLSPFSAIINPFAIQNEVKGQGTIQSVYACHCIVYMIFFHSFFGYYLSSDETVPLFLAIFYWDRQLRETGNIQEGCTAKDEPLEAFSMAGK